MKMKKMVGALALTAALAMGTAPAFAASVSNDAADNQFSDSGSTEIQAKIDNVNPHIRAQVPMKVVVVMGSTGGGTITGPSADKYTIKNIGDQDIEVVDAEITEFNSDFISQPVWQNASEAWVTGTATNGSALTSGNSLMFTLKGINADGDEALVYLTTDHPASAQATAAADKRPLGGNGSLWQYMTMEPEAEVQLELGGNYYFTTAIDSADNTDMLCKIKYTIDAAA